MAQKAPKPIPDGMSNVTAHLWFKGNCSEAIDFYKRAFGADAPFPPVPGPDGKGIMHAMIKVGDTNIMLADAWPGQWEMAPLDHTTVGFFVYAQDCDAFYQQAIEAGCEVITEMMDAFWGDRMGKVKDPFGHVWAIASHKWIYTPQELAQKQKEWQDSNPLG